MVKEISSFSRAINARSSAYLIKLRIPSLICISFIYKENNIGDKIHPCGAPELRIMASDNTRETLAFLAIRVHVVVYLLKTLLSIVSN